jgi:phospholipid/cholesterol/gamma-HCH transport system ATP-binding protein
MEAVQPPGPAIVKLAEVNLRYGKKWVLKDIGLALHAGEIVGLIGPGSSGKTQLIRTIATLVQPRKGELTLFGERVARAGMRRLREVRKRIGLQFQNFALFDYLDVWHNVAFSLEHGGTVPADEIEERVGEALQEVGLAESREALPAELSGGMRRRAAIARVMASQPEVALFDDPVAGLDPVNSARIIALLRDFGRRTGALVIVATHDLDRLLPICTRVVALFDGKVLYDGPTAGVHAAAERQVRDFVAAATGAATPDGPDGGEPCQQPRTAPYFAPPGPEGRG